MIATNQNPTEEPGPRRRLLLVDDHEPGRKSLARLFDAVGYDVTAVGDGSSALATLATAPNFHYILTDVRLPDLDGREVVLAARQIDPTPRIALITGWDVDPDEKGRLGIDWVFLNRSTSRTS